MATNESWVRTGEMVQAHRRRMLETLFKGRRYKIVREFRLQGNEVYLNLYGLPAQHGFVLEALDDGTQVVIGKRLLKKIVAEYDSVRSPFKPPRKRRSSEVVAAERAMKNASDELMQGLERVLQRVERSVAADVIELERDIDRSLHRDNDDARITESESVVKKVLPGRGYYNQLWPTKDPRRYTVIRKR